MKIAVIPYGKKIVVSGKGQIEKPEGYELESRTEGRDGTKLVLVSSFMVIDRWSAHRVFGRSVIDPIDVMYSLVYRLAVLSQGLSFENFPRAGLYTAVISLYNDYRVREEDGGGIWIVPS